MNGTCRLRVEPDFSVCVPPSMVRSDSRAGGGEPLWLELEEPLPPPEATLGAPEGALPMPGPPSPGYITRAPAPIARSGRLASSVSM